MKFSQQTDTFEETNKTHFCHLCCKLLSGRRVSLDKYQKWGEKVHRKKEEKRHKEGF